MMGESEPQRIVAIGDIHGCVHALEALLATIDPRPDDAVICLGDFIDQGRETKDVIDVLIALRTRCRLVTLLGNHEEMLLAALESDRAKNSWLMCGGVVTLNSYRFCGDIDVIPADHLDFIRQCREFYETDNHLFVHANYLPDVPAKDWPEYVLRWSLLDDPRPEPHISGKTVIVGHTEQRNGEVLDLGHVKCIDTACYNYGWLTALDAPSGTLWQASRWGMLRESPDEPKPARPPSVHSTVSNLGTEPG